MAETDENPGYTTLWDEWKPMVVAWWDRKMDNRRQRSLASRRQRRQKALEMFAKEYRMYPLELPPGPVHNDSPMQTFRSHNGDFVREG